MKSISQHIITRVIMTAKMSKDRRIHQSAAEATRGTYSCTHWH